MQWMKTQHSQHRQYCQNRQNGQGFIEMMFVVLFASVATLAIVQFQNSLLYNINNEQQQSIATILASQKIETLRDFDVVAINGSYLAYQNIASGSGTSTIGNTTYTITWTVTTNAALGYKTLDVTVSWTDRYNGSQSVSLSSDVAGIDPANSSTIMT